MAGIIHLIIFVSIFTLLVNGAHARNIAVLGAAAGECVDLARGQDYFERDTRFMSSALSQMGWETTTLTGASGTETSDQAFTLQRLLSSMEQAQAGDQLLISLNTHGGREQPAIGGGRAALHSVCLQGPGGEQVWVSMRTLKEKIDALAARGVKVAVMDSSCYGGGAIAPLAGENICVVAGTPSNLTNQGNDVGLSMIAQAAMQKLPARAQAQLFQHYPLSTPKDLKRNITPDSPSDLESLFLDARTFGGFGHQHMPGQISSEVSGEGMRLGATLTSLALAPPWLTTSRGLINSPLSSDMLEAITGANARQFYDERGCLDLNHPFREIELLLQQQDAIARHQLSAPLKRLGFNNVEALRTQLRNYMSERVRLYRQIADLAGQVQESAPGPSRQRLLRDLEAAYLAHARLNAKDLPERLEKALYLLQYREQRAQHASDPKVQACAQFTL